ncbi:MAG: hypothetical protein ACYC27_05135 [Armatimonadota bacterium]
MKHDASVAESTKRSDVDAAAEAYNTCKEIDPGDTGPASAARLRQT